MRAHGRRTRARTHTHRAAAKRRVPPSPPATLSPSYHSGGATQHEGEAHERRTICCAGATHPPTHCAVSETGTEHLDGVTSLLMRQWPSPRAPTPAGWGTRRRLTGAQRRAFGEHSVLQRAKEVEQTLSQTCFQECPKAQCTFKILMIHGILQFALLIAIRCVLHRHSSRGIHR